MVEPHPTVLERFDELVAASDHVLATRTCRSPDGLFFTGGELVDDELATGWASACLSLLMRVFGERHPYVDVVRGVYGSAHLYANAKKCLGVLKAAREEYASGYVVRLREMLTAAIFSDFLDQAEHLLEHGYAAPAAVVAGCVLEDALRKLACRSGMEVRGHVALGR